VTSLAVWARLSSDLR